MDSDDQVYFDGLEKEKYLSDQQKIFRFNALNLSMFKSIHLFRKTESDVTIRAKMAGTKNYLLDAWQSHFLLVWILNVDNGRDRPAVEGALLTKTVPSMSAASSDDRRLGEAARSY